MATQNTVDKKSGTGLPKNTAAALSYVLGWFTGVIFLILEKDAFVRFHAMQSVVVFLGLTVLSFIPVINVVLAPILMIGGLLLWLILVYKAYQGEEYELPVVGKFVRDLLKKI